MIIFYPLLALITSVVGVIEGVTSNKLLKGDNMKEPTLKLHYDVPARIKTMLIEDAQKEGITATQLLIRLIESNHQNKN